MYVKYHSYKTDGMDVISREAILPRMIRVLIKTKNGLMLSVVWHESITEKLDGDTRNMGHGFLNKNYMMHKDNTSLLWISQSDNIELTCSVKLKTSGVQTQKSIGAL